MSSGEKSHRVYRFGEFSLDLDRETLYRGRRELHLRPKAFQLLKVLLENNGRLVSKGELHETVWEKCVVTDDSLVQCVGEIRGVLGHSGFEMIKTVPRRGYVFDCPVSHAAEVPAPPPPERVRIAHGLTAVGAGLVAAVVLVIGAGLGGELPGAERGKGGDVAAAASGADVSSTVIDAHNEYERGRFFFKRRGEGDLERAEACFKAAIDQDPDFAAAWIGLAGVYSVRIGHGELGHEEGIPLLGDASLRAVRLAPDSAEAHMRRAHYYSNTGEQLRAQEHIEIALALDPNDVLVLGNAAGALTHSNRIDEAIELQRRAIQGDPTSALQHHNFAWMLLAAGRYEEAAVAVEQYRALYPPGVSDTGEIFVDVEILQGNYEQALIQVANMASGPARDRSLAIIHHALGQQAEADAALQRLVDAGDEQAAIHAAEVLAHRGETDAALRWLADVLESPERDDPGRNQLWKDTLWLLSPYLIALRSDERWQALYDEVMASRERPRILARVGDIARKE